MRILIADADARRAARAESSLILHWPEAEFPRVSTGHAAVEAALRADLDLILLDPRLAYSERRNLARDLHRVGSVGMVLLLDCSDEADSIEFSRLGAIDYVVSPFSPIELVARCRAALQLARIDVSGRDAERPLRWSDGYLSIDFARQRVWINRATVTLAPAEFRVLSHLVLTAGRFTTERALLRLVLGKEGTPWPACLGVFIRRLREQIEPDPDAPRYLVDEPRLGYRFVRATSLGRTHWDVGPVAVAREPSQEVARVLSFAARSQWKPKLVAPIRLASNNPTRPSEVERLDRPRPTLALVQ